MKSLLTIGKPNSGKSILFGQQYKRLCKEDGRMSLFEMPDDISPIKDITDCLSKGEVVPHTPSEKNLELSLKLKFGNEIIELIYPDYGGEQINSIVKNRLINKKWEDMINKSDAWLLFIRITELKKSLDLTHRVENNLDNKNHNNQIELSDQYFFIELLQILLFIKNRGILRQINDIKLTVVLSCWDEIKDSNDKKPVDILKENLPLFLDFIQSNWKTDSLSILGLSSIEMDLIKEQEKREEFIDKGSENYGYIVLPDGKQTKDLTLLISRFFE